MIVVAPLGYTRHAWYGAPNLLERGNVTLEGMRSEADVTHVIALVRKEFPIDARRIFAYGWSMGGAGALHLALKHPTTLFAAVGVVAPAIGIPGRVAPFATRERLTTIAHVPAFVAQGRLDGPVPVEQTRQLVDDMRDAGLEAHYREMADEGHEPPSDATVRELVGFLSRRRRA